MDNYLVASLRVLVILGGLAGLEGLSAQQTALCAQTTEPALSGVRAELPAQTPASLPSLPSRPQDTTTLVGGTIDAVDRVRDQFVLRTFGGGHIRIFFDERTNVYLDQMATARHRDLRRGQRVHLDAILDGTRVFARSIYILPQASAIDSYGQVESYRGSTGELIVKDSSLATTLKVRLLPSTVVRHNDHIIAPTDIRPGSLISMAFQPGVDGRAVALTISVVAEAGDTVTFSGRVRHLDLRSRSVVLEYPGDQKAYEIYFDPSQVQGTDGLREGLDVTISTSFDGTRYVAKAVVINP
jgi:hypothetical protein